MLDKNKNTAAASNAEFFGKEPVGAILRRIAPPVMVAQLIQALYNIVDSFFIGRYSADTLIALSFFPIIFSLMPPTFLMAVVFSRQSAFLSVLRQVICFVPIFKLMSLAGLSYCWWAYLITEAITGTTAIIFYYRTLSRLRRTGEFI